MKSEHRASYYEASSSTSFGLNGHTQFQKLVGTAVNVDPSEPKAST